MTETIKIKVLQKSTVKGKMDVRFPANVVASNFLTVTKANGTYTFGVDYTVLTPGPISDPTTAIIAILDQTAGVYKEVSLASLLTSGLDADLQAIAALTGTGILARTADGTWALRTFTAPAAGITITNPAGVAGNPTLVLANDLAAVEGLASNGIAARTATDTWTVRTITAGASIGVTNGDGVAGNPTIAVTDAELVAIAGLTSAADKLPYFTGSGTASLADFSAFARTLVDDTTQGAMQTTLGLVPGTNVQAFDTDLAALAANAGTGLWSVTGSGTGSVRTLTAPAAGITVTNGGGVAGNPTLALADDLAAVEGLVTTGIVRRTGTSAWSAGTAVALTELAAQAAWSFVVNNTSGSASPTAVDIASFTSKASPAGTDLIVISDQAASGALKRATISSIASAGSVSSVNGQTGAIVSYFAPQGRLTLATGTPVMTSTQSAKTTIFYTPYKGNLVPLYDGTNMVPTVVAEISVATTDTTKNPAAIGASKINDWFIWNDSGTIRISHGPDWTDDVTRSAGTALTMVNGILLNNASITNGPAALRGTYVGTTRSDGSSQLNYIFGAAASGGTAAFFAVWNMYNRVLTSTTVTDNGASYTYATNTIRQARASAGNQISFVLGLQEDGVQFSYSAEGTIVAGGAPAFGVGFNAANAFSIPPFGTQNTSAFAYAGSNSGIWNAGIGLHTLFATENSGAGNNTYNAANFGTKNALMATIRN